MKASEFATQLRKQLLDSAADGRSNLTAAHVAQHLERVIPELEKQEASHGPADLSLHVAQYRAERDAELKMFESVLEYGKQALNAVLIINAGAAVALLSFIGSIATKAGAASAAAPLAGAMLVFVAGVFFGALAFGGSYAAQHHYRHENNRTAKRYHIATVIAALLAYAAFLVGAVVAFLALRSIGAT